MTAVVERLFQVSLAGGVLIAAVVLLRVVARRAPHAVRLLLWALVALRLCCPFVITLPQSPVSVPTVETPPVLTVPMTAIPYVFEEEELDPLGGAVIAPIPQEEVPSPYTQPLSIMDVLGYVWLAGVAAMAGSALISWWRLRRRVSTAVRQADGSWRSDAINGPFVLGLWRPRVYLPFDVNEADTPYVLAHERAHIGRRDPLWKCVGFCVLALHWFNPLVWVAYRLFCRDIELACDRRVTAALTAEEKGLYARALLACASRPRAALACPLAFGETGVKQRIQAVLNPKKPLLWVAVGALAVGTVAATLLLTVSTASFDGISAKRYAGDDGVMLTLTNAQNHSYEQSLTIRWQNTSSYPLRIDDDYAIEQKVDGKWQRLKTRTTKDEADFYDRLIVSTVPVGGSSEITYALFENFSLLEKGDYRFVCDFTIWVDDERTQGTAILPFTIRQDPRTVEVDTDNEEVTLQLVRLDLSPGAQTITVKLKNNGVTTAQHSEIFTIERQVGERWMPYSSKGLPHVLLAVLLDGGGEREHTYDLTTYYGDLPNGNYRLLVRYTNGKYRDGEYASLPFTVTGSFDMAANVVSGIVNALSYSYDGELTMNVTWCNDLPRAIYCGEGFSVERFNGDEWTPVASKREAEDEPLLIKIDAYCVREMTYAISDRYETLLPGDYRLVVPYADLDAEKTLALPFRVSNEAAAIGNLVTWRMTETEFSPKEQTVMVSIKNSTPHTVHLKDAYRVFRMTEKGLQVCNPIKDIATLPSEVRELASGKEISKVFGISEHFGRLSPGKYRLSFYFTCNDEDKVGMVDFTIPE